MARHYVSRFNTPTEARDSLIEKAVASKSTAVQTDQEGVSLQQLFASLNIVEKVILRIAVTN